MQLVPIIEQYQRAFQSRYGSQLLPGQINAISAMRRCRTPDSGEMLLGCRDCNVQLQHPHSCGHRSCPQCQNHLTSHWLDRQQAKLLPVDYFMVTFTVPFELRALAWRHQTVFYKLLFDAVISTLKDFGLNPKHLGAAVGMTAVLHTHSRRLDYHPHVHVIVPGGGVNQATGQWRKTRAKYLFHQASLAAVFRARLLTGISAAALPIPKRLPDPWVVKCIHVGKGKPALKYLSRYLYRGVINEHNIIANEGGQVTFKYINSNTGKTQYRTLDGEDFLWLVLQHVLPKGFRRVRDYGFLHGNARKLLLFIQLMLKAFIDAKTPRARPPFKCPNCKSPMYIVRFIPPRSQSG